MTGKVTEYHDSKGHPKILSWLHLSVMETGPQYFSIMAQFGYAICRPMKTSFYRIALPRFLSRERIISVSQSRGGAINTYLVETQQMTERHRPRWTTSSFLYYYAVRPLYTLLPKPGELGDVVSYLLTQQETRTAGSPFMSQPTDLREDRETIDIYGPLSSSLLFVVVVLGLTCLQLRRADL